MSRTGTFISEKKGILGALVCEPQKPDKALLEYFPRKAPRFTVLMGMQGESSLEVSLFLKKILDIFFEINNDAKNLSMFSKPRVTKKQEVQRSDAKMTVYIAISSRQKVKILTRNVAESLH